MRSNREAAGCTRRESGSRRVTRSASSTSRTRIRATATSHTKSGRKTKSPRSGAAAGRSRPEVFITAHRHRRRLPRWRILVAGRDRLSRTRGHRAARARTSWTTRHRQVRHSSHDSQDPARLHTLATSASRSNASPTNTRRSTTHPSAYCPRRRRPVPARR